ncbi:MAG: hypothetical protein V2A74_06380 [bacterium]
MNPCDLFRKKMESAIEISEPPGKWPESLRAHLDSCEACRRWVEQSSAAEELMRQTASDAPEISETAQARILDAVRREPMPRRSVPPFWRTALPYAAALLIVLTGALYVFHAPPPAEHSNGENTTASEGTEIPDTPAQLASELLQPPRVIASARSDFSWLTQTVIEHTASVARAFGASDAILPPAQVQPSPRPES